MSAGCDPSGDPKCFLTDDLPSDAGAATFIVGAGTEFVTRGKERVGPREGFLVVAATWLVAAVFVSLPYLLSGESQFDSPLDALLASMNALP